MAKKKAETAPKDNTRVRPQGGGRRKLAVPSLDTFRELAKKTLGNKTKVAEMLGVSRYCLLKWEEEDSEIGKVFREQWGRRLDTYLDTAHVLAIGKMGEDENGEKVYVVPPDPNMLRFMIEKYGRMEGFGEEVTVNTNVNMKVGIPIEVWIEENTK
ncbi:hypothetical protein HMPREF9134_00510 [Porphyromonas catoniae F0037]|uniref:DNA binding HTH domain-containing protein n=1 Tax=Porphyromonas catoniae F0037 TaxID=1127696 RepID=L1NF39_9PORP|nr:hypothetical protein [Porphyromonas catoniae]EKY02124.1 hypothetical protein HMPREF9134_00510 [Porphyromonas catoniae F0037]